MNNITPTTTKQTISINNPEEIRTMHNDMTIVYFDDMANAEACIRNLKEKGVHSDDYSIIVSEHAYKDKIGEGRADHALKGAEDGAGTGAQLGVIAGLLAGVAVVMTPPIGGILAAGPFLTALGFGAAGAAGGAAAGGLIGALVGAGFPEDLAETFEQRIKEGKILLVINTNAVNRNLICDSLKDSEQEICVC